jgi:hypothetical protein
MRFFFEGYWSKEKQGDSLGLISFDVPNFPVKSFV